MGKNEILEQALHLKANERFLLVEELLKSLDTPDENINKIWEEEANKRVDSYKLDNFNDGMTIVKIKEEL